VVVAAVAASWRRKGYGSLVLNLEQEMKVMQYVADLFDARQADRGNHAPADFPNPSILMNRFGFLCGRVERGTGHHQS